MRDRHPGIISAYRAMPTVSAQWELLIASTRWRTSAQEVLLTITALSLTWWRVVWAHGSAMAILMVTRVTALLFQHPSWRVRLHASGRRTGPSTISRCWI